MPSLDMLYFFNCFHHNALMWLSRCLFTLFVGGIQVGGREVGWAVGQESGGKGGWGVGGADG